MSCAGAAKSPNYSLGFLLTLVAGLATVIGTAFIPALKCGRQEKVTAGALGFASGVMLYVSFVDVLGEEAKEFFENHFKPCDANSTIHMEEEQDHEDLRVRIWIAVFFFSGLGLSGLLDLAMSTMESAGDSHSHRGSVSSDREARREARESGQVELASTGSFDDSLAEGARSLVPNKKGSSLEKVSLVAFIALTLHNVPEGLATFLGGGSGSLTVPFAIAMHNIPEGAAIAVPCYQASGDLWKAFRSTLIAGLAQPVGAGIGWLLIVVVGLEEIPEFCYGVMYSMTAGIMVGVSLFELMPEALEAASPRFVGCCIIVGFFVMELSIVLLGLSGA